MALIKEYTITIGADNIFGKTSKTSGASSSVLDYAYDAAADKFGRADREQRDEVSSSTSGSLYRAVILDFGQDAKYTEIKNYINNGATLQSLTLKIAAELISNYDTGFTIGLKTDQSNNDSAKVSSTIGNSTVAQDAYSTFGWNKTTRTASLSDATAFNIKSLGLASAGKYSAGNPGNTTRTGCYRALQAQLYVKISVPQITLTTASNNTSYGTVTSGTTLTAGGTYTVKATAKTNYKFNNWSLSGGGSISSTTAATTTYTAPTTLNSDATATLTGNFAADTVSLTIKSSSSTQGYCLFNGGTTHYTNHTFSVTVGASQTLQAVANSGYKFTSWSIPSGVSIVSGSATSATITIKATATATITAVFNTVSTRYATCTFNFITADGNYSTKEVFESGQYIDITTKSFYSQYTDAYIDTSKTNVNIELVDSATRHKIFKCVPPAGDTSDLSFNSTIYITTANNKAKDFRFIVRHGDSIPSANSKILKEYELGYCSSDNNLYINNGGTIKCISHQLITLWSGSWISGDIIVPNTNKYNLFLVKLYNIGGPILVPRYNGNTYLRGTTAYGNDSLFYNIAFMGTYVGDTWTYVKARRSDSTNSIIVNTIYGVL